MWSSRSWWEEPLHLDLPEVMDDLDPGWASWRGTSEQTVAG